jgi:hypothetical protein
MGLPGESVSVEAFVSIRDISCLAAALDDE